MIFILSINQIDVTNTLEPGKYIRPAKGILATGGYNYLDEKTNTYIPVLGRLPGYPIFLALIYKLFGVDNNLIVVILQSLISGLTVLGIALTASEILKNWFWPSVVLASFCFNIVYRASTVMPETIFIFFIVWGTYFQLRIYHKKSTSINILSSALMFSLALLTRPAALLLPFLTVPATAYLLYSSKKHSKKHIICFSFAPSIIAFSMAILPVTVINHAKLGKYIFSSQAGQHSLYWLYPCLENKWGCGKRSKSAINNAKSLFIQKTEYLTEVEKNNPVKIDHIKRQLARHLILSIPLFQLITASTGSSLKLMMHTSMQEILERFGMKTIHISEISAKSTLEKISLFLVKSLSNKWSIMLFLSQLTVLFLRLLQILGIFYGLYQEKYRPITVWLLSATISFIMISVGIGNYRYRSPAEPMLILFALLGIEYCMLFFKKQYYLTNK